MNYRDEILVWMAHVREVIYEIAESARAGDGSTKLTHGQARDVMKIGLQAVRITKKVAGEYDLIAVHKVWNTDALKELIERMERSLEYKKVSGLLQMVKQMKALVTGAHNKSSKNAERAAEGLPPKERMKQEMKKEIREKRKAEVIANVEDGGDKSGKPKKRIKSSNAKTR